MRIAVSPVAAVALFLSWATLARSDDEAEEVVLAIHGGAGVIERDELTPEKDRAYRAVLEEALRAGYAELERPEGTSLDAVVAAIRVLEDSPLFNAGQGAAFTHEGRNELDAAIMQGRGRMGGAVTGVTTIKNPIVAARLVMEQSKHVLLAGRGADEFAAEHRAEVVCPSYFRTEERWQMLQEFLEQEAREKAYSNAGGEIRGDVGPRPKGAAAQFGTVGCVALDGRGDLAAGTSTGGLTGKLPGRVGDAPVLGAGTFADNLSCAVSATGDGEYFMRAMAAHDIAALMEYRKLMVAEASRKVIHEKIKPAGGEGGVIVLDPRGRLAMTYSSPGMYRGYVTRSGQVRVFIFEK